MRPLFSTLRSKVLVSFIVVAALLTWGTLLLVRYRVQIHVDAEIAQGLQNSVLTFERFQRQRNATLRNSAALLANQPLLKALMTSQDTATIQDGSAEFWNLVGSELFVLADRSGALVALHTSSERFRVGHARASLAASLASGRTEDWWFGEGELFQVFFQPIYLGTVAEDVPMGLVGVGFRIDEQVARDIAGVASGEVVFHYGDSLVATTVSPDRAVTLDDQVIELRDPGPASADVLLGSERFLVTSVDVTPGRTPDVRLTVLKSYDQATAFLRSLNRWILALGILAVLGGGVTIFTVSATITQPLGKLVEGVQALERGDFDYPLDVRGDDEVSQLTAAFDRMRRTVLDAQRRLVDSERLAVIGRMASSISHDLRHPLTAIVAYAEFLAKGDLTTEQRSDFYQEIRLAVDRMTDQISSLLGFSQRGDTLQLAQIQLNEPISRAVQIVRVLPEFSGLAITWNCDPSCRGWLDSGKVERVVLNLLFNACEAVSSPDGAVHVECGCRADRVEIRVSDNGQGVPDSIRQTLFEPFTSAEKEKGIGLGLTAVQMLVHEHGGEVRLERTGPEGSVFCVSLPVTPPSQLQTEL